MKKVLTVMAVVAGMALTGAVPAFAALQEEMKYLGFSDEIARYADEHVTKSHVGAPKAGEMPAVKIAPAPQSEADAVQQQLTELGRTRSMVPDTALKGGELKSSLNTYWNDVGVSPDKAQLQVLPEDFKADLRTSVDEALVSVGYTIKQLDLIDVPMKSANPMVRLVLRVVRPLKTANGYQEIQGNLAEIRNICQTVGTVNGTLYISELTTFIAEDPRNKYYYEKTILNP